MLPGENEQDFHQLANAFQASLLPANPAEQSLVHQMVLACWKLRRYDRVETSPFVYQGQGALFRLSRFYSTNQRCFYRALDRLRRLRPAPPLSPR